MKIEKISWKSEGLKISGAIYIPEGQAGILPALIICHGIPAKAKDPDDQGYSLLAERFCRKGFIALIFNFRGTGLSEGNFDLHGWAWDLEGALDYISRRPEVDRQRIFVMGFSGGAAVSIYVAARRREIAALISCASPADFEDLIKGRGLEDFLIHAREVGIVRDVYFPASRDDWEKSFQTVRPLDWVARIPPRPFLIVHGTDDRVVDASQASALYEKVRGKAELFLINGAEHRLRLDERALAKAEEWLGEIAFSGQPSAFSQKIYSDR